MRRKIRIAAVAAGALLGGLFSFHGRTSAADPKATPKPPPNLTVAATVTPERVGPGKSGVVHLVCLVRKTVHVYSETFKVLPKAVDGVTYGKHEIKTKAVGYVDPNTPNEPPEQVWFDKIEIDLPFTLTDAALPPLKVGADIRFSCCDVDACYQPETIKPTVLADVSPPEGWVRPAGAPPLPAAPVPVPAPAMGPDSPVPAANPVPNPNPATNPAPVPASTPKPAELTLDSKVAKVLVKATASEITVTFTPAEGYHLYPPGNAEGEPLRVTGKEAEGVRWREPKHPPGTGEFHAEWTWTQPYERTEAAKTDPTFVVHWAGCNEATCEPPETRTVAVTHEGGKPEGALVLVDLTGKDAAPRPASTDPKAAPAPAEPAVAVPPEAQAPSAASTTAVVGGCAKPIPAEGKLFAETASASAESPIDKLLRDWGIFFPLAIFALGLGLAFTPCVLPLIPITISIIGGSAGSLSRGRLTFLLGCYVAGLCLAFGSLGVIAGLSGGSMAAAFQSPIALWIIASVFIVLAFGMFGVYEMQPPQWMQRIQGGAKGGSPIGAFLLGGMGAVIASPCTGPFIAAMLLKVAEWGDVTRGFLMFATFGLGMGSVLFAAGSLNLVAKPGPWMVWVKYAFGIILIGLGLYYLADAQKITPQTLFILGGVLALAGAVLVQRHLIKKEGEESTAATKKAAVVGILSALVTLLVAVLTRPQTGIGWTSITSREQLCQEVEKAKKEDKVVVVDVWATWCPLLGWDHAIESNEKLSAAFAKMSRLRIDVTEQGPWENGVRDALAIDHGAQPYLLFLNQKGEIVGDSRMRKAPSEDNQKTFEEILKKLGVIK